MTPFAALEAELAEALRRIDVLKNDFSDQLANVRATARADALREAADLCDQKRDDYLDDDETDTWRGCEMCAEAIRSLIPPQEK